MSFEGGKGHEPLVGAEIIAQKITMDVREFIEQ